MKHILIISFSKLARDPRVLRQIESLKDEYKISTIGDVPVNNNDITFYNTVEPLENSRSIILQKIKRKLKNFFYVCGNYRGYFERRLAYKNNIYFISNHDIFKPDAIIANESSGLHVASELKKKHNWDTNIYFDAHEYTPKVSNTLKWRLFKEPLITRELLGRKNDIFVMSTVCNGIAREYERLFNFPDGFVKVVTNAAEYNPMLKPTKTEGVIKLIHHGGAIKRRKLELMIEMMKYLDPGKYELTFMLVKSEPEYYDNLVAMSKNCPNIYFIEPVCFNEIAPTLNNYDVGIFLLLPEIFNYKHALPNKLFEFVQARLAIAIGPSPEMANIVDRYSLGDHSNDFTPKSLAKVISQMTPDKIMEYKQNADKYAMELSADANMRLIKSIIKEIS